MGVMKGGEGWRYNKEDGPEERQRITDGEIRRIGIGMKNWKIQRRRTNMEMEDE